MTRLLFEGGIDTALLAEAGSYILYQLEAAARVAVKVPARPVVVFGERVVGVPVRQRVVAVPGGRSGRSAAACSSRFNSALAAFSPDFSN
jgi:hypothetical protein